MFDLYSLLSLVVRHPGYCFVLLLLAILVVIAVLAVRRKRFTRIALVGITICAVCLALLIPHAFVDYFLLGLGSEDDLAAEQTLEWYQDFLSDKTLLLLLRQGQTDANAQFYLAVIAAQRGLLCKDANLNKPPGFMMTNDYSAFGSNLIYPISYGQFYSAYRRQKVGFNDGSHFGLSR